MDDVAEARLVHADKCELEGPYECLCGGHVMVDSSFLEQASMTFTCPYCRRSLGVKG